MRIVYQVTRGCTLCMDCILQCLHKAIRVTEQGMRIDEDKCAGCGLCRKQCPSEAITQKAVEEEQRETRPCST